MSLENEEDQVGMPPLRRGPRGFADLTPDFVDPGVSTRTSRLRLRAGMLGRGRLLPALRRAGDGGAVVVPTLNTS